MTPSPNEIHISSLPPDIIYIEKTLPKSQSFFIRPKGTTLLPFKVFIKIDELPFRLDRA